jgi:hypothetical protein
MKQIRFIVNAFLAGALLYCSSAAASTHPQSELPRRDVALKYASNASTGGTGVLVNVKELSSPVRNQHIYVIPYENGSWSISSPIELLSTGLYGNYSMYQYSGTRRFYAFYIRYDREVYSSYVGQWFSTSTIDDWNGQAYELGAVDSRTGNNVKARDIQAVRNVQVSCNPVRYCQCLVTGSSIQLTGNIFVQNLSYNKRVGVRYGVNDVWSTPSTDLFAGFAEGTSGYDSHGVPIGVERWHFDGTLANSKNVTAAYVDVALFYTNVASSMTYWDNNFEQNYRIEVTTRETCTGMCCSSRY